MSSELTEEHYACELLRAQNENERLERRHDSLTFLLYTVFVLNISSPYSVWGGDVNFSLWRHVEPIFS